MPMSRTNEECESLLERIPRGRGDLATVTGLRGSREERVHNCPHLVGESLRGAGIHSRCRQVRSVRGERREFEEVRLSSPPFDLSPLGVREGASSDAVLADAGYASAVVAPNLARSGGGFQRQARKCWALHPTTQEPRKTKR